MGYCPLRCSAIFRSSRSVVVYFRPHGNMIGGARPGRGALVQMHCQGEACITNHFRRLNGSMTKKLRNNRRNPHSTKKNHGFTDGGTMHWKWILADYALLFWCFFGGHRACSTLSPLTLKTIFHSLFYGISTGCLKYHANARVSSIGFGSFCCKLSFINPKTHLLWNTLIP